MTGMVAGAVAGFGVPTSDVDIFSDAVLLDPYPTYRVLREQGRAVWLNQLGMFIFTHFADVQNALADWETFTSAKGVTMNDRMNAEFPALS